jgi:predicted acyltransferase (DUF342 family)
MKTTHKFLSVFSLLALLMLTFTTPALAFDGRGGDEVLIKAGEVIEDDLYVGANTFVLEGTVKGDLITINGTVEGDLIAAGQAVIINGSVTDDVRIAGAGLQIGEKARIGGDLVSAGASLEAKDGSSIGNDLVFGGGQALIAGSVSRNILTATSALELRGPVGGNVKAYVDVTDKTKSSPPMRMYGSDMPISLPTVPPGLTIDDGAKIAGNLEYTSTMDLPVPSGVVVGKITRIEPQVKAGSVHTEPTAAQIAIKWSLNLLRSIVTLVLFGLLLGWLVPSFVKNVLDKLQAKPLASFGWGLVAYAAFFFVILLIVVIMVMGGLAFGLLTLGGVSGTIIWVGLVAVFELIVGFVLVTVFLTKILTAWLTGKWIINRFNPTLADHKLWPLALGVVIVALAVALPYVGWIIGLIVMFLGLGALWIWGQGLWQARKPV